MLRLRSGRRYAAAPLLAALILAAGCASPSDGSPGGAEVAGGSGAAADGQGTRLLMIGLDAADEKMIGALREKGRLPAFERFYREGATGPLASHRPMLSPILWTSIATGVSPERHGVLSFVEIDRDGYASPIGSGARRAAAFWDVLGRRDVTVGVIGWLATHPAGRVNGWLVSDRLTLHPFDPLDATVSEDPAGKSHPAELHEELMPLIVRPGDLTAAQLAADFGERTIASPLPARDERVLRVVSSTTRTHAAVAEHVLTTRAPAVVAVYFDGIDRLLHVFGELLPPALEGTDAARAERFGAVVDRFYESIDRTVSRLVDSAGPAATVLIVSDHGWRSGPDRPVTNPAREGPYAAEWHRNRGVLFARGPGVRKGARVEGADIYDVAPTVLAMFGAPRASDQRGAPILSLFEPGTLPAAAAAVATHGAPPPVGAVPGGTGAPGARAAVENLRALGYVGRTVGNGAGGAVDRSRANLATVFLDEGRLEDAVRLYGEYLRDVPDDFDARFNLAWALSRLERTTQAAAEYEQSVRLRPGSVASWLGLAEMRLLLDDNDGARAPLARARALAPSHPGVANTSGVLLCETGRTDECLAAFRRSIELNPAGTGAWMNLARVLNVIGRRDEAVSTLRSGLAATDGSPELSALLREIAPEDLSPPATSDR